MASVAAPQVDASPPEKVSTVSDSARSALADDGSFELPRSQSWWWCGRLPVSRDRRAVNADDRYWYLWVGWRADGSVLEVFRWSWGRLDRVVDIGRLNTLTQLERRLVCLPVIELAVATSTPIVVYQALVKLLLFVGSMLSGLGLVRAMRWRDAEGRLVQASRGRSTSRPWGAW
jgi:hypothetical protein